uniref:Uncharacterized protein n=1 Tax=uncultured Thiotrichaceae bacterium TaxID=298394 RepID=A0A6S6TC48_9GAMM|nr:MAG: Unknown protein [uncultured Thiotrichaceae bacterium]
MPNLVDIPVIVSTLVTFFTMGGTDASIELLKGVTVNGALKLAELKDELIVQPAVNKALEQFQQNPLDVSVKSELEEQLKTALENHPALQQMAVQVQGDIKAEDGSVAAAVISGNVTITNGKV